METYEDDYTVEMFDNGIAIRMESQMTGDVKKLVSLTSSNARDLGEMLMGSIGYVMNVECCNKVAMRVEIMAEGDPLPTGKGDAV